jgi:transcription initiation factor TFIIIB Brf1 subunit/transcription initiation factor TFIIB
VGQFARPGLGFLPGAYGCTDCPWCGAKNVPKFSRGQITCGKIGCQEQQRLKMIEKSKNAKSKRVSGGA